MMVVWFGEMGKRGGGVRCVNIIHGSEGVDKTAVHDNVTITGVR